MVTDSRIVKQLPDETDIVVVGGGAVGCSVAYHLTELGCTDVLLIEKDQLSSGSTWHAAGLTGAARSTAALTHIARLSRELYKELESDGGVGYVECGGLWVARSPERLKAFEQTAQIASNGGVEAHVVSAQEAARLWPIIDGDCILGGLWLPDEGRINPVDLTQALARRARQRGALIRERVALNGIRVEGGRVRGVQTSAGDVACRLVINAAGQWAPVVGAMVGAAVPLHPVHNMYVVTAAREDIPASLPNLRDPDESTYYKSELNALVVGGLTPETAQPWVKPSQIPEDFAFRLLEEDWDAMMPIMESASELVPMLDALGLHKFYNGPESYTPDHMPLFGAAPNVEGYYTLAGMNGSGIGLAGGMGLAAAAILAVGEFDVDLSDISPNRFGSEALSETWVEERVRSAVLDHFNVAASHESYLH